MICKPGVRIHGVRPETVVAMLVTDTIFRTAEREFVVTSVSDGKHSRGSRHYSGCAFDCRISHLQAGEPAVFAKRIGLELGSDFDVILEKDHIHVEYDPKEAL